MYRGSTGSMEREKRVQERVATMKASLKVSSFHDTAHEFITHDE